MWQRRSRKWIVSMVSLVAALGASPVPGAEPLGPPGLGASYRLAADPGERPEHEQEKGETVTRMAVALGAQVDLPRGAGQWFQMTLTKQNGRVLRLWLLLDGLPAAGQVPTVERYIWSEPQWPKPLEYRERNRGTALLPRLGLWERGWPRGLDGRIDGPEAFPQRVQLLGYPFERTATVADADVQVPDAKRLVLDPHWISFTIDAFRYDAPPGWRLSEQQAANRYGKEHYKKLSAIDLRRHIDLGVNLFEPNRHADKLDLWQEPVFLAKAAGPWPEIVYRSNFYSYEWHLNEPTVHHRAKYNDDAKVVASWTPAQLARSLLSHVESLMTTWRGYGLWRHVRRSYGLGDLARYQDPVVAWDRDGVWPVMAGGAGGVTVEGSGFPGDLPSLNMHYGSQIPHTDANRMALATAVLRGAARNFGRTWGLSFYDPSTWPAVVADMDFAYRHGATHVWLWGGWPDVDADYPHAYKLAMFEAMQNIARRHGPRDMHKLLHAADVAIVLPTGYSIGFYSGTFYETWWMHMERRNAEGVKLRTVMHQAYVEAERLLREGTEFDIVVDHELRKQGYGTTIYILEDGRVRVEASGETTVHDGARVPARPDFGPGPRITARFAARPDFAGDPFGIAATVELGAGDVARRDRDQRWGQAPRWLIGTGTLYRPDGFSRPIELVLTRSEANGNRLVGAWTHRWSPVDENLDGTYRIRVCTIDEFARWDEAWLEVDVRPRFKETPIAQLPPQWTFRLDPDDVGTSRRWFAVDLDESAWGKIAVPAWWEKAGYPDYDGVAWYRVTFEAPAKSPPPPGEDGAAGAVLLAFGAVDGDAIVYLNGIRIGAHDGDDETNWNEPFELDIGRHLRYGGPNQLTLRVRDTAMLGGIFKPVRIVTRRHDARPASSGEAAGPNP